MFNLWVYTCTCKQLNRGYLLWQWFKFTISVWKQHTHWIMSCFIIIFTISQYNNDSMFWIVFKYYINYVIVAPRNVKYPYHYLNDNNKRLSLVFATFVGFGKITIFVAWVIIENHIFPSGAVFLSKKIILSREVQPRVEIYVCMIASEWKTNKQQIVFLCLTWIVSILFRTEIIHRGEPWNIPPSNNHVNEDSLAK